MKVALELQPCCGNRSGIGSYAYELAKRVFCSNTLVFCGNIFCCRKNADVKSGLNGITIPVRECAVLPYSIYRRIWHIFPVGYNAFFQKAEVNVFFDYIVPPRISGHVLSVIHDLTYLRFPQTMSKRNQHRIQRDIQYSIKRSDKVITISEFSKREIIDLLHIAPEKIEIVSPAPSLSKDIANFRDVSARYQISKPFLLYVGTLEPRKNLMRLMQAFEKLKQTEGIPHQLVLAGGKGWNSKDILEHAQKNPDILTIGYVTNAEKNALYQNASLFAFPSLYEGFGIPPLEAMHFGCPVVCANAASLPEVVGDAAELVDPMKVGSIAEGMLRVLTNGSHRDELVQKGYIQAKKFNWEDSANKLMQICRDVLEES